MVKFAYNNNFKEDFFALKYKYVYIMHPGTRYLVNIDDNNCYQTEYYSYVYWLQKRNERSLTASKDFFKNKNIFLNKLVNYTLQEGKKLTSYRIFNLYFNLFFSFFEKFNSDLSENYKLYDMYYKYAQENRSLFFNPMFPYYNVLKFLEPSFIMSFKKPKKSKRKLKKAKELKIDYIKPKRRLFICLKSIMVFSKSFSYVKKHQNLCYSLLNIFLSNKNSVLYKRKILTYEKLLKMKKKK